MVYFLVSLSQSLLCHITCGLFFTFLKSDLFLFFFNFTLAGNKQVFCFVFNFSETFLSCLKHLHVLYILNSLRSQNSCHVHYTKNAQNVQFFCDFLKMESKYLHIIISIIPNWILRICSSSLFPVSWMCTCCGLGMLTHSPSLCVVTSALPKRSLFSLLLQFPWTLVYEFW